MRAFYITAFFMSCSNYETDIRRPNLDFQSRTIQTVDRLLVMGDSISAGQGAATNLSYAERLCNDLDSDYPSLICENLASGGTIIEDVEFVQLPSTTINPNETTVIVMTTGGNNFLRAMNQGVNMDDAEGEAYIQMKSLLFELEPNSSFNNHFVFVGNIYDPGYNHPTQPAGYNARLDLATSQLSSWSVDIYGALYGQNNVFAGDGIHPNNNGHALIKQAFRQAIAEVED